jgi:hypothetical protein
MPFHSITELPEKEAYQMADILGKNNGNAFYRFKDFVNYYPRRIKTEKWLYNWFLKLGGKPEIEHPLYFVLEGSDYLNEWFDKGKAINIPLSKIDEKHISFTIGDSNVIYHKENRRNPFLKNELIRIIKEHNGKIKNVLEKMEIKYIECQLWNKKYLEIYR